MVIIHELLYAGEMTKAEIDLIEKLKKRKIISVVKVKDTYGVARWGTNRGKASQLYKHVKQAA